jgi:hypothetical protein
VPTPLPTTTSLVCHPATGSPPVQSIAIDVRWSEAGALALSYRLTGDLARLRIPMPCASQRADGLWRHTCFEAFVAHTNAGAYREFNFSPSTEWAAYRFSSYRKDGVPLDEEEDPRIVVRTASDRLELDAVIGKTCLPAAPSATLHIALAAVIEDVDGGISYWALRHPPGRPDFHHSDGFALELDARGPRNGYRSTNAENP